MSIYTKTTQIIHNTYTNQPNNPVLKGFLSVLFGSASAL